MHRLRPRRRRMPRERDLSGQRRSGAMDEIHCDKQGLLPVIGADMSHVSPYSPARPFSDLNEDVQALFLSVPFGKQLPAREREVMRCLMDGLSEKQIAAAMMLSP